MTVKRKFTLPKVGQKINSWTVRIISTDARGAVTVFICQCSCSSYKNPQYQHVRGGKSTCCDECRTERNKRYTDIEPDDDLRRHLTMKIHSAFSRCHNKKDPAFKNYGARGIAVKFLDVRSFLLHLVSLDGHDNKSLTLDRINNDGHYELGNLRFTTRSQQTKNQRKR